METTQHIPTHIAIIMDGNGRWAKSRGLPRALGHHAGANAVRRTVEAACDLGVGFLTLYAFSWENWSRPSHEVQDLMGLLEMFLRNEVENLCSHRIRVVAIGRLQELPNKQREILEQVIEKTSSMDRMTLVLALSYGGRQEIVDAARQIAKLVKEDHLAPEQIDESTFATYLYTAQIPDPDLLIRTSGEQRLSNFLLWQSSYTELYITPTLWPDFSKDDLLAAIDEYAKRERRFGRTPAQVIPRAMETSVDPAHSPSSREASHVSAGRKESPSRRANSPEHPPGFAWPPEVAKRFG